MRAERLFAILLALSVWGPANAEKISDVRNTRHNLSVSGPGTVKAATETQVCVFCHTPHAGTQETDPSAPPMPLWNRRLSGHTYANTELYRSSSLDALSVQASLDQPGGSSKLCLSCHDGTLAIGNVNVLNGQANATITMQGTGPAGVMPSGAGDTTGFTRKLGVDLTNDHPISLTYDVAMANRDGELRQVDANQRWPADGSVVGVRAPGFRPKVPLEPTGGALREGQVQCGTCHDPHSRELDASRGPQKFLRLNRFQELPPSNNFDVNNDIVCLSCHDKNQGTGSWAYSAHANDRVANQIYKGALEQPATPAGMREFPTGLPVWKAGCLNCHDTHTVQGARRLLREGTDSVATPKLGGGAALEETCYQCHTDSASATITPTTTVPNIRNDFQLPRRMPIRSVDQPAGQETHDIAGGFSDGGFIDCSGPTNRCGKDMIEPREKLGAFDLNNRHAECTDCHNPHRVVKFRDFRGNPAGSISGNPDPAGTHSHVDAAGAVHTNIASGVLRGAWGVEPIYGSPSFQNLPISYIVKRGDPGNSVDDSASAPYVTREYQICLKCHSDYGYSDNNVYPLGNRPEPGYPGGTPDGTNFLQQYTNQAKEFQAPFSHRGETTTADSGAAADFSTNNHRSWHPVIDSTGRTGTIRGNGSDISTNWHLPWSNGVGTQTMYCSDCHGSNVALPGSVVPDGGENGNPWGPHGSTNDFLLKGQWNIATGTGQQASGLCFKCHEYNTYSTRARVRTGFYNADREDLHSYHADKIGQMRCSWCHVAVPHGWKNKAFLVNLNDVGPEAGLPPGTQVRNNTTAYYNNGPYYMNALLKVRRFAPSGQWLESDCGSVGTPGNGESGRDWMRDSNENCKNPP